MKLKLGNLYLGEIIDLYKPIILSLSYSKISFNVLERTSIKIYENACSIYKSLNDIDIYQLISILGLIISKMIKC